VIVTCRNGPAQERRPRAQEGGFQSVFELRGGINAWEQASLPVEKVEK
jgi:rhodanese-related sulfurtransferase